MNSDLVSDTYQVYWVTVITVIAFVLNVRQLWKWRNVKTPTISIAIKFMSLARAIISFIIGLGYFLEAINAVTFQDRADFFVKYLSPIYWPVLLIMPVLMVPPYRAELDHDIIRAEVEKVLAEVLISHLSGEDNGES